MTTNNVLPSKLNAYVRRLRAEYQRDAPRLAAILEAARIGIIENSSYDNWNGGTKLHRLCDGYRTAERAQLSQGGANLCSKPWRTDWWLNGRCCE